MPLSCEIEVERISHSFLLTLKIEPLSHCSPKPNKNLKTYYLHLYGKTKVSKIDSYKYHKKNFENQCLLAKHSAKNSW